MVASSETFLAKRISRTSRFEIHTSLQRTFPLFGPMEEIKWAEGWSPEVLFMESGVGERMMFRTESRYADESFYTWVIVKHQPPHHIEYLVTSKDRMWFITVSCDARDGHRTEVEVTYTYTGFTEAANEKNQESLDEMFSDDLQDWAKAINHFLETGEQLRN